MKQNNMLNRAWQKIGNCQIVVVKVGTSSLSYPTGKLNYQKIDKLAAVLSQVQKSGKKVILVSSGAIAVGAGKLGLASKPVDLAEKQALAALGQAGLMKIYQRLFESYGQKVAQVLLTKDIVTISERRQNASNTLNMLLSMDVIPVINENDTVAVDEIVFGDNDTLSAYVACLVNADLLILLSDIDGLYSADPRQDPMAEIIPLITTIDEQVEKVAKGAGSSFGTGGMVTKISAAKVCCEQAIPVNITNGANPEIIYMILAGKPTGTLFYWEKDICSEERI
jgi:glutamate 5-kinase